MTYAYYQNLLRSAGLKATPRRIEVLDILSRSTLPLSVEKIRLRATKTKPNTVTLYRMLVDLEQAKIIRYVDLRHGHAHYEIADPRDHHHLICTLCGTVENFAACNLDATIARALKKSKKFFRVTDHALELFGICAACAKKNLTISNASRTNTRTTPSLSEPR